MKQLKWQLMCAERRLLGLAVKQIAMGARAIVGRAKTLTLIP